MRLRAAGLVSGIVLSLGAVSIGAAVATTRANIGSGEIITVKVDKQVCHNVSVNGLQNDRTAIGTTLCGDAQAFAMTASEIVTHYQLPSADAVDTYASNVSSNGTIALIGTMTKSGPTTSYLLSGSRLFTRPGTLTTVIDPAANGRGTNVNAVNASGEAVGDYCKNIKCTKLAPFTYSDGTFSSFTLKLKAAREVVLSMITDTGTLDGYYLDKRKAAHGFQQGPTGKVTVINAPDAGKKAHQGTVLLGGAKNGSVCGEVFGAHHTESGFVQIHGESHLVDLHPYGPDRYHVTVILAINGHGYFGGQAILPSTGQGPGFVWHR